MNTAAIPAIVIFTVIVLVGIACGVSLYIDYRKQKKEHMEQPLTILKDINAADYFAAFSTCECCGVSVLPAEPCPCEFGFCANCSDDPYADDWMYRASGGAVTSMEYYRSQFSDQEWHELFNPQLDDHVRVWKNMERDANGNWDEVPF